VAAAAGFILGDEEKARSFAENASVAANIHATPKSKAVDKSVRRYTSKVKNRVKS
jgi:hypothetical protein